MENQIYQPHEESTYFWSQNRKGTTIKGDFKAIDIGSIVSGISHQFVPTINDK